MKKKLLFFSLVLFVIVCVPSFSEVIVTPRNPNTAEIVSIVVTNQYTSEASITSESIEQTGNTFFISLDVNVGCTLPNAPILTSEFELNPLPEGDYQVSVVINHTSPIPICEPYTIYQSASFIVSDSEPLACVENAQTLCLQNDRFEVKALWRDHQNNLGEGQVVPGASSDSGMFYFFNPNNWEMLIKVLDACDLNDRYWVFAAATTDVEYTLIVRDSFTGVSSVYTNELGVASPAITDTGAFSTCP